MFKILICLLLSIPAFAQKWTPEEWNAAHTAANITVLTPEEKEVIRYINLARLYPAKFATLVVQNYVPPAEFGDYLKGSPYKESLYNTLLSLKPLAPLQFDQNMYELAKCFAIESGKLGIVGHERKSCSQEGILSECCDYGSYTGKDIALSLLIDHDVPNLGHRVICLSPNVKAVGVKIAPHKDFKYCTVLDFK